MGVKGSAVKVLNVQLLEKTVFDCNRFIVDAREHVTNINANIRALKDDGLDKLVGGQGDFIVSAIKDTEKGVEGLVTALNAISKSLNEKLAKTLEAYKDKNGLQAASDKAKSAAANATLKKQ